MMTQRIRIVQQKGVTFVTFSSLGLFNLLGLKELSLLPIWITTFKLFPNPNIVSLTIDTTVLVSPLALGVYSFNFTQATTSPPNIDATLEIEVVSSLTQALETCDSIESICIVWINREGGRSSYVFDQRKDYGIVIGENKTYDNGGVIRYSYRGKNFDTKTVYKTGISDIEVDLIESLRYSIQAWEYDLTTDISTPILLDSNSFPKYNTKNNFNEISFTYRLGKYKKVQAQ